ncbi:MAG TPA: AarF/ABC1/UbiB kinase family protein [Acidimicrobiales bacterium]|jgi:predicted unusual protein kinase regulating ubiquinone biosynthesis (AarF/ABC1/UbiB family)|nr:AarF/ABC1/UbiB kinase family protein [Acidimicrobiales bacterium]
MPERKLPTSRITRALKPAATSAKAAIAQGAAWARTRSRPEDEKAQRQLDQAIRSAQQVAELMGEMKGAFMKIGQLLSFADTAMLPPEVRAVLASLQADAPPMAYELVAEVVTAELGQPPGQAFDWFSPEPIAAASIGQVHMAEHQGRQVVVKVQYPGVADAVAADLNNAGLMAAMVSTIRPFVRAYMGHLDVKALADELKDRVLEELDYTTEAASQQAFAQAFEGHPFIRIPEVVPERSTARVLTTAYHDGMRWAAAVQADQDLRDTWGEVVYRFVFGSLYRQGLANADPHPGNYLFHEDGTVTFLDFGCIKRFTAEHRERLIDIGRAVLADDAARFAHAMAAAGFGPEAREPDRLYAALRPNYLPVLEAQPWTYSPETTKAIVDANLGMTEEYRRIARHFEVPPDYLFLGRVALGTHSVLSGLRATGHWRSVISELWLGAPPETELGRVEQRWRARNTHDTKPS